MPVDHRRMLLLLIGLFWLLGAAGASAAENECDSNATGTVVAVRGLVEATPGTDGNWQPLHAGRRLCSGFTVRTGRDGMAAIWLDRERTMVRLRNSSSIRYSARTQSSPLLSLIKGATYLFSRTPIRVDLKTPHVNGGIEGTEFLLHVSDAGDRSFVQVFEGVVSAQTDQPDQKLFAAQGETITASAVEPPRKLSADQAADVALWRPLVEPLDQVQWTLHYPFLTNTSAEIQNRLRTGDIAGARALLESAPVTADTVALRLIIQIVQARTETDRRSNLDQAERAADVYPRSQAVALALSYAQQSVGDVEAAQRELDRFASIEASGDQLTLRRAELALINDRVADAVALGSQIDSRPDKAARANSLLGYAALQQVKLKEAESRFQAAVAQDGHDPAARFGLGLTRIRRGDVPGGRQDIEFAASLAPNVSLYRSYLGRAYAEERKRDKAQSQFDMAKERDPQDPTPWFFEANQHFVENRPIDAFHALNESIERNDNRAVYRSKENLSDDIAVRGSVLSGIYRTLGLEELGIPEAAKSIATSPADHAGHRFLADLYADQSLQDYARASEILQAQLLQPLTLDPVRPQLAETDLTFLGGAGFNGISFNEYATAFETNGHRLTLAGLGGNYGTAANELLFSGLQGKVGYNISQFHYESDGVRDNNDVRHDIISAFVQGGVSPRLRLQAEFRFRDTEQGDLSQNFERDDFSPTDRTKVRTYSARIGGRFDLNHRNLFVGNLSFSNIKTDFAGENTGSDIIAISDLTNIAFGAKHIFRGDKFSIQSSFEVAKIDIDNDLFVDITGTFGSTCPPMLVSCVFQTNTSPNRRKINLASYIHLTPFAGTNLTLGLAHEDLNNGALGFDVFLPKIGVHQKLNQNFTVRAAYIESTGGDPELNASIQPSQIAGFSQMLDVGLNTTNEQVEAAVEFSFKDVVKGHFQASRKKSIHRIGDLAASTRLEGRSETKIISGLLSVFPNKNMLVTTAPAYSNIDTISSLLDPSRPDFPETTRTFEVPLELSYFVGKGAAFKIVGTFVRQKITPSVFSSITDRDESFGTLDLEFNQRFYSGRGNFTLSVKNVLGTEFRYQEKNGLIGDSPDARFASDTLVSASATIRF